MKAYNEMAVTECECEDCQQREQPCLCDCEPFEDECIGCRLEREAAREAQFDIECSQGSV